MLPLADVNGKPVAVTFGEAVHDSCRIYSDDGLATDWRDRALIHLPLQPEG